MAGERPARICLGAITGAQGVRGAVRIKPFTARPEDVAAYGPVEDEAGRRSWNIRLIGKAKGVVIGRIPGIEDRDAAAALKGVRLYVDRAALPPPAEEEYYHADLLGLAVVLSDGTMLGRVRAVHEYGAGDCIEVTPEAGAAIMVPFTKAAVPTVDLAAGRLVVEPPPGLLDGTPEAARSPPLGGREKAHEGGAQ
ncbi:MAG: 16S rRNA processing protein RimM [Alphaproteobacteria bacterium]|nr:16S rRNA processing protein RimM [Alphaproteobacteria bacterium]